MKLDLFRKPLPHIHDGETELNFDEEILALIENVNQSLSKGDGSGIKEIVLPACSKVYSLFLSKYRNEMALPPELIREMVGMLVIGFTFSDWINSRNLKLTVAEEDLTTDQLVELTKNTMDTVKEAIEELKETAVNRLCSLYEMDPEILKGKELEEIPNVVRGELEKARTANV